MKVKVTQYGLRPFRITEVSDEPIQFKGEFKLPKNVRTTGGGKWVKINYWFNLEDIKK